MTANHVLGLKVVLPDGEVVELGGESLGAGRRHRVEAGQCRPAPQTQALIEALRGRGGITGRQRRGTLGGEWLEPRRVQFPGFDPQQVTRRAGGQPVGLPG